MGRYGRCSLDIEWGQQYEDYEDGL
jgi:hypothetical protein